MIPVLVTGLGVVSPLGHSVGELARRVAAGEQARGGDDGVLIDDIPTECVPADKRARIGRMDRLCRLFLAASYLAVDDARLAIKPAGAARVGLSFGSGLGCLLADAEFLEKLVAQGPRAASPQVFAYTVSSAAAGEASIALGIRGPNVTAHLGLAAGLGAIGYGFDLIQLGKADVVLAGGADANGPALARALRDMGLLKTAAQARPFVDAIPGVWASEGAAVAVLERADRARARGATAWGRIDGYAAGFEPTLTRRTPETAGIAATLRRAVESSGRRPHEVGAVFASAHGTPLDAVERRALDEVFGPDLPPLFTPKTVLGETFGASGALNVALACAPLRERAASTGAISYPYPYPFPYPYPSSSSSHRTPVVLLHALCYAGSCVSLLLSGEA